MLLFHPRKHTVEMVPAASHDPHTLLPCRSSFLLALELAVAEAQACSEPLALLVVAIDPVVAPLATENHHELLPTVAKLLRFVCGKRGIVGYLGADSFALMRRNVNTEELLELADSLRTAVALNFAARKHPMTASVGVACCSGNFACDATELLTLAESRGADARAAGGNQVRTGGSDIKRQHELDPCPLPTNRRT